MTETQHETQTILIRPSRLPEAEAKIVRANRRLERAGVAERFTLTVGDTVPRSYTNGTGGQTTYSMLEVTLNTPSLGYGGWTFVATLGFEAHGTIVRTVPGQSCDYHPTTQVCDQCHTARQRSDTFVVRSDAGEYRQVGRSCLALFFGLKPQLWVFDYELSELDERDTDESERRSWSSRDRSESVREIVAAALACSDRGRGYRRASEYPSTATDTDAVLYERATGELDWRNYDRKAWLETRRADAVTYANDGTVDDVIAAAANIDGDGEYAQNLRILAQGERVDGRNFGLVVSFVAVYARSQRVAAERSVQTTRRNTYVAPVGEKNVITTGAVTMIRPIESQYGTSYLIVWVTAEGDTCKWFSSNAPVFDEGATVTLKGTVKSHDEFRGTKATVFTRCKPA